MQALSFAVHIPLVCFGIAFPAMVLRAEWLWMRTGDEIYRVLAMRWPFALAAAAGGIASQRVPVGSATGDLYASWLNPTSLMAGVLALLSSAHLAAVYLAASRSERATRCWSRRFVRARSSPGRWRV